jgi:arsenate reductase
VTEKRTVRVLFLCTHNSARSQMAEAMLRTWGGGLFEACSAGAEATRVRDEAIVVMRELDIDISQYESKTADRFSGTSFDWLITVCDMAADACPTFPGPAANHLHWDIADPSSSSGSEMDRLAAFRSARDQIAKRVQAFISDVATGLAPAWVSWCAERDSGAGSDPIDRSGPADGVSVEHD